MFRLFIELSIHNYFDIKILHLVELENFNLFGLAPTNLIPNYTIHLLTTTGRSLTFLRQFLLLVSYIEYSYQECSKFYPKSCALDDPFDKPPCEPALRYSIADIIYGDAVSRIATELPLSAVILHNSC